MPAFPQTSDSNNTLGKMVTLGRRLIYLQPTCQDNFALQDDYRRLALRVLFFAEGT